MTASHTRAALLGLVSYSKDKKKGCLFKRGYDTQSKAKQKQLDGFAELLQALTHIHRDDFKCNDLLSQLLVPASC